jgi:hypothetical protein
MSSIMIQDLPHSRELDRHAMLDVHGGNSSLASAGAYANVNVDVNQNIIQYQNVQVNAFNNVHLGGADIGPLHLNVSPSQYANTGAVVAF